jgi:hypothetical protein
MWETVGAVIFAVAGVIGFIALDRSIEKERVTKHERREKEREAEHERHRKMLEEAGKHGEVESFEYKNGEYSVVYKSNNN